MQAHTGSRAGASSEVGGQTSRAAAYAKEISVGAVASNQQKLIQKVEPKRRPSEMNLVRLLEARSGRNLQRQHDGVSGVGFKSENDMNEIELHTRGTDVDANALAFAWAVGRNLRGLV